MNIICIESSTLNCSVALGINGEVAEAREEKADRYLHAERLHVFIDDVLGSARIAPDAIAVSVGPGSYTGLRIGVSAAKGLAFGFKVPLIAMPTLEHFARHLSSLRPGFRYYLPMLDARRMEVYTCLYDTHTDRFSTTEAHILTEASFADVLGTDNTFVFGDGSRKAEPIIARENVRFEHDYLPSAEGMVQLAEQMARRGEFADLTTTEPFYLKDFVAGTPNRLL